MKVNRLRTLVSVTQLGLRFMFTGDANTDIYTKLQQEMTLLEKDETLGG